MNLAQSCLALPLSLSLALALAACGSDVEPVQEPEPMQTITGPRTLISGDFNDQEFGPKIEGPQGTEVVSELAIEGTVVADIVSYVACPAPSEGAPIPDECIPADQPEDAVFTYVHRVTPRGIEADPDFVPIEFRTTRHVSGFANNLGFDRDQAEAALGEGYVIRVQIDNRMLVWRIETSNGWDEGEEITFFWQSTEPPEGPQELYAVETAAGRAVGTGPFPADTDPDNEEETGDESTAG